MKSRLIQLVICTALFAAAAAAQPVVTGALNTASYALPGLPNGSLAQGSMIAIFGRNLGPASIVQATSFPLPKALDGGKVSAKLTVGATTADLILTYALSTQMGAIIPSTTPVGAGTLTVTYNGQTSAGFPVNIVRSSFGVFSINQAGSGPGILQNFNSAADQPVNTILASAKPGQVITLWGTGLGPITGDDAAGPAPGALNFDVEVLVGGRPAVIRYKGRSGCCAGIDQIVFDVPAGILGCYVPVVVKTGNVVSNSTYMAITANGGRCADGKFFTDANLQKVQGGGTLSVGALSFDRINLNVAIPGMGEAQLKTDAASGMFFRYNAQQLVASQFAAQSALPTGSCVTFASSDQITSVPDDPIKGTVLNAGTKLTVTRSGEVKDIPREADGFYSASLYTGITIPGLPGGIPGLPGSDGNPFLEPGAFTVAGAGGSDVGAFTAQFSIPAAFNWTNQANITSVVRSNGQEVTWSGATSGQVFILGSSYDKNSKSSAGFYCVQNASAGRFTVPSSTLLSLPRNSVATSAELGDTPTGILGIGIVSEPVNFSASGLDVGILTQGAFSAKSVNFQ